MRRILPCLATAVVLTLVAGPALAQASKSRILLLDAQSQVARGNDETALSLLQVVIEAQDLSPELQAIALAQRGNIQFRRKNYPMAHADFTRALAVDPDSLQALRGDCFALLNMRRFEEAQIVCEEASRLAGQFNRAEAADILGYAALMRRDYGTALRHLDTAIAEGPDYAPAYLHRGLVYLAQKNETLARDDFLKARNLWPQDREIERTLRQLGVIF